MDDTICDFKGAYEKAIIENPGIQFPQSQYGFFRNLKPLDGAIEAVQKLHDEYPQYEVYLLTAPSMKNPLCYSEKREWVETYLGYELVERLIISPNKALLKGDVLIDDMTSGKGQEHFEGKILQYGSTEYPDWQTILEAVTDNDKEQLKSPYETLTTFINKSPKIDFDIEREQSGINIPLIFDSLLLAAVAHKDQRRKGGGGSPYINHLIELAHLLTNVANIKDTDILIAAILHDALEDTDISEENIGKKYGTTVLKYIKKLSDDKSLSLEERRQSQIETVSEASDEIKLIKLADHCSNVSSIPESWDKERLDSYFKWSHEVSSKCFSVSEPLSKEYLKRYEMALSFL